MLIVFVFQTKISSNFNLKTGIKDMLFLRKVEKFLRRQGTPLVNFVFKVGELFVFITQSVYNCLTPPFYGRNLLRQVVDMGFYSLPVVGLTTIFAGMVIALQSYSGFASVGAESMVASVVLISVTRELAPVLSALMVAGRIGAAMAAEIGTMRVTEQIDALTTLSTNPFKYLVAPRVWAGLIVMPLLVLFVVSLIIAISLKIHLIGIISYITLLRIIIFKKMTKK